MSEEKKPHNDDPDWERIEVDYRAGILSLREIATKNPGSNHVAISRRAKREGWTRDLSAKIKAKAEELVTKQTVTKPVTEKQLVTEREVIEANAAVIARIRGEHRGDIARARNLAVALLSELESQTDNIELYAQLGELLQSPDEKGIDKLNEIYTKVIGLPSRIDGTKKLAETLKHLIGLEREAYSINNAAGSEPHQETNEPLSVDPIEAAKAYAKVISGEA